MAPCPVVAEQQRADALHAGVAGAGEGEAADDELLLVEALAFEPVGAAAGVVDGGGALGDDAFGAELAGAAPFPIFLRGSSKFRSTRSFFTISSEIS